MENVDKNQGMLLYLLFYYLSRNEPRCIKKEFDDLDIIKTISQNPELSRELLYHNHNKLNKECKLILLNSILNDEDVFKKYINNISTFNITTPELKIILEKIVNNYPECISHIPKLLTVNYINKNIQKNIKKIKLNKKVEEVIISYYILHTLS